MSARMNLNGPFLVLPTKRGAIPCLTPTQSNAILEPEERLVGISVFEATDFIAPCTASKMPLTQFCGLEGYQLFMTVRSTFQGPHPSAPSTDAAVAGDCERGRVVVSSKKWEEVVHAVKPRVAVSLHESVPLYEPLNKRRRIAATRSETWGRQAADLTEMNCKVLHPISLEKNHKEGYVDALWRNENLFEFYTALDYLHIPQSGWSMAAAYTLPAIAAAMCSNVTFIESPLPWALAEKGVALVLVLDGGDTAAAGEFNTKPPVLDLNDNGYTLDIQPLCASCPCYTCTRHNRAYLHHLLTVQEMNSEILLVIHNLTQLVLFMRSFRQRCGADRVDLVKRVISQF